jgi:hypothetical protein
MESGSDPAGPQFYRYAISENIVKHYFMKFLTAYRGDYSVRLSESKRWFFGIFSSVPNSIISKKR